jgi:hypothetical protein
MLNDVQRGILSFVGCENPTYAGPPPSIPVTLDSATPAIPVGPPGAVDPTMVFQRISMM